MTFANAENATLTAITTAIIAHAANRPRSLQTAVGCSALGTVCQRQLAYRVAGVAGPRARTASWVATIGTSVHTYLETVFSGHDRYLTEQPVTVTHDGVDVPGTVDLYDKQTRTVVDFKVVGDSTLAKARRGQVSDQYVTQVNLYALGLTQAGHNVANVAVLFLPKTKELGDAVFFEKPFDQALARAAMSRFASVALAVRSGARPKDFTPSDAPCVWCDWYDPNSSDLNVSCPGVLPTFN